MAKKRRSWCIFCCCFFLHVSPVLEGRGRNFIKWQHKNHLVICRRLYWEVLPVSCNLSCLMVNAIQKALLVGNLALHEVVGISVRGLGTAYTRCSTCGLLASHIQPFTLKILVVFIAELISVCSW